MAIDESFSKPGAVPFKWEIRPGVPKHHFRRENSRLGEEYQAPDQPSDVGSRSPAEDQVHHPNRHPLLKLKAPPAGPHFARNVQLRDRTLGPSPSSRSDRWRFERRVLGRPEIVSGGCFPSPLLKRKSKSEKRGVFKSDTASKVNRSPELESWGRWSVSSRKSLWPFSDSVSSSPYSSNWSSPRPAGDAEWASFGLF